MEKLKKNINSIGKGCRVLSVIFLVLMIIATAGLVIGGVVLSVIPQDLVHADVKAGAEIEIKGSSVKNMPDDTAEQIAKGVNGGALKLEGSDLNVKTVANSDESILISTESNTMNFSLRRVGLSLLPLALLTGSLIVAFVFLGKLMKELETCSSPFTEGVVKAMSAFAVSLIPFAVIRTFATSLSSAILLSGNVDVRFGVDLSTVFAVLIILLLVTIFKYGVSLQKESDETL